MTSSTAQQGKGASVWPCSHLFCGTFVPFEFFPGPVLKVLSVSLTGNLPNRSQDLSVEEENLLPSHELLEEGESKLQLNTHPLHLSKQPATRKVPLNRTRQKPKLIPEVCLGSAHQSALGRLYAEVAVAVGSQVSGTMPQKITGDTAPGGRRGSGGWENLGYLLQRQRPGRQAGGRHGSRLVRKVGSGAWG